MCDALAYSTMAAAGWSDTSRVAVAAERVTIAGGQSLVELPSRGCFERTRIGDDRPHEIVLHHMQHVQPASERVGERPPIRQRGIRRDAKVGRHEDVRSHVFAWRLPDGQDRTGRGADNCFGNASHHGMCHAPAAVCAHDDEVGLLLPRKAEDFGMRSSGAQVEIEAGFRLVQRGDSQQAFSNCGLELLVELEREPRGYDGVGPVSHVQDIDHRIEDPCEGDGIVHGRLRGIAEIVRHQDVIQGNHGCLIKRSQSVCRLLASDREPSFTRKRLSVNVRHVVGALGGARALSLLRDIPRTWVTIHAAVHVFRVAPPRFSKFLVDA